MIPGMNATSARRHDLHEKPPAGNSQSVTVACSDGRPGRADLAGRLPWGAGPVSIRSYWSRSPEWQPPVALCRPIRMPADTWTPGRSLNFSQLCMAGYFGSLSGNQPALYPGPAYLPPYENSRPHARSGHRGLCQKVCQKLHPPYPAGDAAKKRWQYLHRARSLIGTRSLAIRQKFAAG